MSEGRYSFTDTNGLCGDATCNVCNVPGVMTLSFKDGPIKSCLFDPQTGIQSHTVYRFGANIGGKVTYSKQQTTEVRSLVAKKAKLTRDQSKVADYIAETIPNSGISAETVDAIVGELHKFNHISASKMLARMHDELTKRADYFPVKQSRDDWHDAWFSQRDLTGKAAWEIPTFSYLKEAPTDPRNFKYMALVDKMLEKFIRVIEMGMRAYNAKKKSDDAFKAHWNFAASAKTMEYYAKRHEAKV